MAEIARFKLRKPITAHRGELITELVLNEPTGGLYLELGNPLRRIYEIAEDGTARRVEQIIRYSVMPRYLAGVSNIKDPLLISQMHYLDISMAIGALITMFDPPEEKKAAADDAADEPSVEAQAEDIEGDASEPF